MIKITIKKCWAVDTYYFGVGEGKDFESGYDIPEKILAPIAACIEFPHLEQVLSIDVDGDMDDIHETALQLGLFMAPRYGEIPDGSDFKWPISEKFSHFVSIASETMERTWKELMDSLPDEADAWDD